MPLGTERPTMSHSARSSGELPLPAMDRDDGRVREALERFGRTG